MSNPNPNLKVTILGDSTGVVAAVSQARAAFGSLTAAGTSAGAAVASSMGGAAAATRSAASAGESMTGSFFRAGAALEVVKRGLNAVRDTANSAVDAILGMERAQRSMQYATGNGAADLAWARKEAQNLGLEVLGLADAYGEFAASARGTRLEGQGTRDIFHAAAQAATVLGLSTDDTNGVFKALGQMLSKGKVQAEELRGQLGERLPGAFQMAARAMGVTTAKLDEMLKNGEVIAEDMLPKLAVELGKSFGPSAQTAATGLQAQINRLKNAATDFYLEIGKTGGVDLLTNAVVGLSAALRGIVDSGALRIAGDLLGNVVVQATLLAVIVPKVVTALVAAVPALRAVALATAIAGWSGLAAAVQSAGAAVLGFMTPWTLAAAGILAAGVGLSMWARSYAAGIADAADKQALLAAEATKTTQSFVQQHNEAARLEKVIRSSTASTTDKKNAQQALHGIVRQLIQQYPDFLTYLKKEGEGYTDVTGSMEKYAKVRLKILRNQLEFAKQEAQEARDENTKWLRGSWGNQDGGVANAIEWLTVGRGLAAEAEREAEARGKTVKELERQIALLENWSDGTTAPGTTPKPKGAKVTPMSQAEHDARVARILADGLQTTTREQKLAADAAERLAKAKTELARVDEQLSRGEINAAKATEVRRAVWMTLARQGLQDDQRYATERKALQEKLQEDLAGIEAGGLEQRNAKTRAKFAEIRKRNAQFEGGVVSESTILSAETEELTRNRIAQIREDLEQLRREMADLAQEKGRALTPLERQEAVQRFARRGSTQTAAALQYGRQENMGDGGVKGAMRGLEEYLAATQDKFGQWKQTALDAIKGVEQSFQTGVAGILSGQMTLGQGLSSIWKGIVNTIAGALASLAAKYIATAVAQRILGQAAGQSALVQAAGDQQAAAAAIFRAHAYIPFAGPALAAGFVAMMQATLAANAASAQAMKVPGRAIGGRIDRPEFALVAEAGPEIIAPEKGFQDYVREISSMSASMAAGIARREARVGGYRSKASGMGRRFEARSGEYNDYRGAILVDSEPALRNLHAQGRKALGRFTG